MNRLSNWILDRMARFVAIHKPERLNQLIRDEVQKLSSGVAIRASMEYLDKQGFLHCAFCPQRFGLQRATLQDDKGKSREVKLCMKHYSQSGAARSGSLVHV
jgi:hypothetical protein